MNDMTTIDQTATSRVRVVLLLEEAPQFDPIALIDILNDILAPAGLRFERRESREGLAVCAGAIHAILRGSESPLEMDRLLPALGSRLGELLGEDWTGGIARHQGYLELEVAIGAEEGGAVTATSGTDWKDLVLTTAHVGASWLARVANPTAVYWEPSAQLFSCERFLAMADMLYPLPLFLHPRPFSSGRIDGQVECVGFDLLGAEAFVGRPLRFAEAPARLDWLVRRALALVAHVRATGDVPAAGESFGTARGEVIRLRDGADGVLELVLEELDDRLVLQPPVPGQDPGGEAMPATNAAV